LRGGTKVKSTAPFFEVLLKLAADDAWDLALFLRPNVALTPRRGISSSDSSIETSLYGSHTHSSSSGCSAPHFAHSPITSVTRHWLVRRSVRWHLDSLEKWDGPKIVVHGGVIAGLVE
jgi:hypothetical protein